MAYSAIWQWPAGTCSPCRGRLQRPRRLAARLLRLPFSVLSAHATQQMTETADRQEVGWWDVSGREAPGVCPVTRLVVCAAAGLHVRERASA